MTRKALSMNKIIEAKRLSELGVKKRAIARSIGCSRNTLKKYLAEDHSLLPSNRPLLASWKDLVDWNEVEQEHNAGVSLKVIWEEYTESKKLLVQYPAFWKCFDKKFGKLNPTMIRQFEPGSSCEIDYCDGIDIINLSTGEITKTHLFVGVLCFSRYTFAEFSYSQKSEDFLNSHVRMFKFFGGTPKLITPDNLKSAVIKTNLYDPDINFAYTKLASHFDVAVVPARVRHPKDKAIVERTIQIFQRWFFSKVRKMTFTSLVELNRYLSECLKIFNEKHHRILKTSRVEKFEEEKSSLKQLPDFDYEVLTHKRVKLHIDCHCEIEANFYSAPWTYRDEVLDAWISEKQVSLYFAGECIAIHTRKRNRGKFITDKTHYPPNHRAYLEVTPTNLRCQALELGAHVSELMNELMPESNPLRHLRRCQGIIALKKKYSKEDLDYGCKMALLYQKYFLKFIEGSIKNKNLNNQSKQIERSENKNLRGEDLFIGEKENECSTTKLH